MKKSLACLSGEPRQQSAAGEVGGISSGGGDGQGRPSGLPLSAGEAPDRAQAEEREQTQQQQQQQHDVDMAVESELLEVLVPSFQQPVTAPATPITAASITTTAAAAATAATATGTAGGGLPKSGSAYSKTRSAEDLGSAAVSSVADVGEHGRRDTWGQELPPASGGSGEGGDPVHARSGGATEADTGCTRRRAHGGIVEEGEGGGGAEQEEVRGGRKGGGAKAASTGEVVNDPGGGDADEKRVLMTSVMLLNSFRFRKSLQWSLQSPGEAKRSGGGDGVAPGGVRVGRVGGSDAGGEDGGNGEGRGYAPPPPPSGAGDGAAGGGGGILSPRQALPPPSPACAGPVFSGAGTGDGVGDRYGAGGDGAGAVSEERRPWLRMGLEIHVDHADVSLPPRYEFGNLQVAALLQWKGIQAAVGEMIGHSWPGREGGGGVSCVALWQLYGSLHAPGNPWILFLRFL